MHLLAWLAAQPLGLSSAAYWRLLSVLCEAMTSIPLLLWQKETVAQDVDGLTPSMGPLYSGVWVLASVGTPLRAACTLGSFMTFQLVACTANRLAIWLSLSLASCYLTGALLCSIRMQMVFTLWCVMVGVANIMLAWKLLLGSEQSLRRTALQHPPAEAESEWELDRYTDRLQRWGTACVICLEEFKGGDEVARLLCGHSFHEQCVRRWLKQHKGCPYRCSATEVAKRNEWEAQELANEAADGGDNKEQLAIDMNILCGTRAESETQLNVPGRSNFLWCTL